MIILILGLFDIFKREKSLEHYLERLQELQEETFDILINIAGSYFDRGKHEDAKEYLEKAFKLALEMDDKELEALVLDSMGEVYLDKREIDTALEYFKEAFKIYSSIKSPLRDEMKEKISEVEKMKEAIELAKLREKLGETPQTSEVRKFEVNVKSILPKLKALVGRLENVSLYESYPSESAVEEVKEALEIASAIDDELSEAFLLLFLGTYSFDKGDYEEAFNYFKQAEEIFVKMGDKKSLGAVNVFLAVLYFIRGDEKESLENFKTALKLFKDIDDSEASKLTMDIFNSLYGIKG